MLQMMIEFLQPIVVDDAELALDAQREVLPGGHFFGAAHTMQRYQNAFYQPLVSSWQSYENWQASGARDATQRATAIWRRALTEYEQPAMDPAVLEALDAYVAKRREQIGAGEP
jgi:trimethylamine--corrinoid protein Co-methyltransferase